LLACLLSACSTQPEPEIQATPEKPNVIVILTDDQGWADVGFNGATDIPTPQLDRLAKEGVIFTNGYVSHPYCSPSRAGLLTGRYQARFGHDCNMPYNTVNDESIGTPLSEIMLSEALKEQGYRTSAIGKWHVGDHPALHPPAQGFDHWFGFPGGGMNYWGTPNGPLRTIVRNNVPVPPTELTYLTDDFTDEAIDVITAKDEKPFFIYLAYNAPHAPDHATAQYLEQTKHIEYSGRSIYAAMVNAVDAGIGRIDSTLIANGIKENTMVIFLSDNGGRGKWADNRPGRGFKGMLFEGGIKVPFFLNWPAAISGNQRYEHMVTSLDIYPTVVEAAGADTSAGSAGSAGVRQRLDGKDLMPFLSGKNEAPPHHQLFWRSVGGYEYAVRKGDYKLYKNASKEKTLLFNLKDDPGERQDIAATEPEIMAQLETAYLAWDANNLEPGWQDPHIENCIRDQKKWEQDRKKAMPPSARSSKK